MTNEVSERAQTFDALGGHSTFDTLRGHSQECSHERN